MSVNSVTLKRGSNVLLPVVVILAILLALSLASRPRDGLSKAETQRAVAEVLVAAEPCEATDAFTVACTMDALKGKFPPTTVEAPDSTTQAPATTVGPVASTSPPTKAPATTEDPTK